MSHTGTFEPDIPGVIVVPAHSTNILRAINRPVALVIHTPEEPADDVESTPRYFAFPNRNASTHYYTDNDGDLYQMVPEEHGAIANGLRNRPRPIWAGASGSLNYRTLSNEVEGYARAMHRTCPLGSRQWVSLRNWIISCALRYEIEISRVYIVGHFELADNRSDPGTLKLDQLVAEAATLARAIIGSAAEITAEARIRRALGPAYEAGDWETLHNQLHYLGL